MFLTVGSYATTPSTTSADYTVKVDNVFTEQGYTVDVTINHCSYATIADATERSAELWVEMPEAYTLTYNQVTTMEHEVMYLCYDDYQCKTHLYKHGDRRGNGSGGIPYNSGKTVSGSLYFGSPTAVKSV